MNTLVICEKNMAARRIAYILSEGSVKQSRVNGVPCYTFENGDHWSVIGLRGHIIKLDYPREYNRWDAVQPLKLVDVDPVKKISNRSIAQALRKLAGDAHRVIIATDYDREGELIGVEGLSILDGSFEIQRAKFSSLMPYEIRQAFRHPTQVDYNLSASAEARQIIDLAWGATLTRFISLASRQLGRDFLSVGRVQTPTLALIVDREKEIEKFTPTPYWLLQASLCYGEHDFTASHTQGKFWEKDKIDVIYRNIRDATTGTVVSYQQEIKEEFPPAPFNTTSFLREASRHGFTAASAMRIAESLYMRGYISYPRTDNTVYPSGMNMDRIMDQLAGSFGQEVRLVRSKRRSHPTRGKTMSKDHPPIHPVGEADRKKLSKQEWRIYDLIVRRFLATLTENARAAVSRAEIDIQGEKFGAEGYQMLEENWRAIYDYYPQAERWLQLEEDTTVDIQELQRLKKQTQPPKRYQQGSLLAEMEKHNLGTKSTRHDIIEKLYHRRYIKGKNIRPTLTGVAVTEALQRSADRITKPDMTAELEQEMNDIAEGNKTLEEVVADSRKLLREALQALERRKEVIGTVIQEAMAKQRFMGKCNQCGSDLKVITSRRGKRFVGCSNFPQCQNSYPLPQRGTVLFNDEYCDKCGAPIVTIITRRKWKKCINPECPSNT